MSNLVMARIKPLNGPLLAAAEQHGRRLDDAAIRRKVRDVPSLTWVPEEVGGDPLALSDRLADHIAGALVPKAKAKALHMLVKLPASVPVETEADARAALALVVQFAQDTYGGRAVFSARMDRDERSLNSVDLFLAPRYVKVTKRKSQEAMSLTRFGKLLAVKRGIEDRADSAKGSMQAQGSALQDELADWLTVHGFEAQRGVAKERDGDDWKTPEVMGARKDRGVIERLIAEQLPEVMAEAEAAAEETKRQAAIAADAAAAAIRAQATSDAETIRSSARLEAERLMKAAEEDRERRLGEAERAVADDRAAVDADRRRVDRDMTSIRTRAEVLRVGNETLAKRESAVTKREAAVSDQAGVLAGLLDRLEPMLAVVADAHAKLKAAPEVVRRWLDPNGQVRAALKTGPGLIEQARAAARGLRPSPSATRQSAAGDDIDLTVLAAARDGGTGRQ